MYGALLLFESEFVHIVAISFTSLILTELLMVALTIQTWHWLMIVAELLSLSCYIASLVFLHEFIGNSCCSEFLKTYLVKCKARASSGSQCTSENGFRALGQLELKNCPSSILKACRVPCGFSIPYSKCSTANP